MSIYKVKPAFQGLLRPIVKLLASVGVTANQVTLAAVALSGFTGAVLYWKVGEIRTLLLLPVVLFLRMALNAVDGMLAREHNQKSQLGQILNELGDVISDAALYLPLGCWPGFCPVMMSWLVVLAAAGEMTGVLAVTLGAPRGYQGPLGKSDRAFLFGLLGLLLGLGLPLQPWVSWLLVSALLLSVATIVGRARTALKLAQE